VSGGAWILIRYGDWCDGIIMKNILYTISAALVVGLSAVPLLARPSPQPNIVHIMVDDLGWQDIASHKIDGKPVYETPHLDRLTREGRRFTHAYSPAPSCAPSRVAFLRGQHPVNTGVYHVSGGRIPRAWNPQSQRVCPYYAYGLPVEEPMIPETLKRAGYYSGHVGKWHAGGKSAGYPFPLDQGFDFGFTENKHGHKYYNDPELWNPKDGNKNFFFGSWARMQPDRLSDFATEDPQDRFQLNSEGRPFDKPLDLALGFIKKNKNKPFFLNYCPYYVHGPIQARNRERFEHYLEKMGYPFPTDPGTIYKDIPGHSNPYYASMVDEVDWMIGQVIQYLEATDDPRNPGHKLIDNTYVIVDSDNGGVLPYTDNIPLRGGKQNTWEGGVRIPFLVRGPGVPAGTVCDTPINLIDLYPTFMAMAGVEPDPSLELDGCNLLPLIHGESERALLSDGTERESLFWYFPWDAHMSAAIRKGDWKLVHHYVAPQGGKLKQATQLYRLYDGADTTLDLSETHNAADQYPEKVAELLSELNAQIARSDAPLPHRNASADFEPEAVECPAILELGSEGDRVWATFETGVGKSPIVSAQLLYTVNPKQFDSTRGNREEWFAASASVSAGRVEARMPPGATHATFSMVDANGFLLTAEAMPAVTDVGHQVRDSSILKNGYAYKPGMFALIRLGEQAQVAARKQGANTSALQAALGNAKAQLAVDPVQVIPMTDAIRSLRAAIRNQTDAPEARHPLMNRFPVDPHY